MDFLAHNSSILLASPFNALLRLLVVVLLIRFVIFVYRASKFLRHFTKLPQRKGHPLFGDIPISITNFHLFKSSSNNYRVLLNEALGSLSSFERQQSFIVRWLGWYPVVDCLDYQSASIILNNKQNLSKGHFYKLFTNWLGEGLLISSSTKWRHRRNLILPVFTAKNLKKFIPIIETNCANMLDSLALSSLRVSTSSKELDELCHETVLNIVCETLLGLPVNSIDHLDRVKFIGATNNLARIAIIRLTNPILWSNLIFNFTSHGTEFAENYQIFLSLSDKIIHNRLNQRRKALDKDAFDSNQSARALIDLLIDEHLNNLNPDKPGKIDIQGIQEEIQNFMFAGYETTASTLIRTLYLIGLNKSVQNELYSQISCFNSVDWSFEKLDSLVYLESCIKESLRLYPTTPIIARCLDKPISLEGNMIPSGTIVAINIAAVHRDPKVYSSPDKFDPRRWISSDDESHFVPKYSYIPFSSGPRVCIGQKFATIVMKIMIAVIIRKYEIISTQSLDEVQFEFQVTIKPVKPFQFVVKPRPTTCLQSTN